MKKIIVILLIAALAALSVLPMSAAFGYSLDGIDADELVTNTIISFGVAEDIDTLVLQKDKLYDLSLEENGLEYIFNLDGKNGFALLTAYYDETNDLFSFSVEEIYFDKESPYSTSVGKKIYIDQRVYLEYHAGIYKECTTKTVLPEEIINALEGDQAYSGDGTSTSTVEYIEYKYKYDNSASVPYGIPQYVSSYENSCGNIVGGNIVGYYDAYKTNLIPNYTPTTVVGGKTVFKPNDATTQAIVDNFYYTMGTYVANTTYLDGFDIGLTGYIQSRGYSINYIDLKSGSSLNYASYKQQVLAKRITALFYTKFNYLNYFIQNSTYDKVGIALTDIGHAMVGYGCREINYFRDEQVTVWSPVWYNPFRTVTTTQTVNFRNDTYLMVNIGWTLGYTKLNSGEILDHAYAIEIV